VTPATITAVVVKASRQRASDLVRLLEAEGDIRVAATASDCASALSAIRRHEPHAVVMDLALPPDGGQATVEEIMSEAPTPILALSDVAADPSASAVIRALQAGAVEALPKPARWTEQHGPELRRQVRRVSGVPVIRRRRPRGRPASAVGARPGAGRGTVIAIAASTGGPPALATVLREIGEVDAPILVVQHIHASFASGFAAWLAGATGRHVSLAVDGDHAQPCQVHVAPGGLHMRLAANRRLELSGEPASLHRPSADVLFESVARHAGARGVGVLLTGMGEDGAQGLLAMRRAGGLAVAQDEATSAVYGMPRAADRLGAAELVLPLPDIAAAVRAALVGRR
jgi:two-component system chemotaxis response regulator CheB